MRVIVLAVLCSASCNAWREPPPGERVQLTIQDVQDGMALVKPRVERCHEQFRRGGLVEVALLIHGDGSAEVSLPPAFVGDEGAQCFLEAVRGVRFRSFTGPAMRITYPYVLR